MTFQSCLPLRLFTTHGTVLFVDTSSGDLRHGPLDSSPANVTLAVDGVRCQIMYQAAGALRPTLSLASGTKAISASTSDDEAVSPTVFQLVRMYSRWVGLKAEDKFLSATPDGRLTLTARWWRAWESFLLSEPLPEQGCDGPAPKRATLGISCVETRDMTNALRAVERTVQCIKADCLYWFSNSPYPNRLPGVEVINITIPHFTDFADDINRIYLRLMPKVVTTDFNLTIQPDGFAVNPQSWDDRFWEYDYIGAPWPAMFGPGPIVGNGGFSLRSRKLYDALLDMPVKWRVNEWFDDERLSLEAYFAINPEGKKFLPEDLIISLWYRGALETSYGLRFCPPELANKFSVETVHDFTQYWLGRSFGFHGIVAAPYYGVTL